MTLTYEVAARCDIGCVRKNNEDSAGYDTELGLFVVCDGMGGALAGEVASSIGVDTMLTYFAQGAKDGNFPRYGAALDTVSPRAQSLASAIALANTAVFESGKASASRKGMGSTIVAMLVKENFISYAHVGDSRIYLYRDGDVRQLTQDHSLVMEQVRRGYLTREEAEVSEMNNYILRALGSEESVEPDVDEILALPGDIFLLATDGLTKLVSDEGMRLILSELDTIGHGESTGGALQCACERLVEAARSAGGDDNITCLLLRFQEEAWYKKLTHKLFSGGGKRWRSSI